MNPVGVVLRWGLVVSSAVVVQSAVTPHLALWGVVPNLMVILAVCAGLSGGAQRGAVVGFWVGLAFDVARPVPLGLSALAYTIVAFGAGTVQVVLVQAGRVISMLLVSAASVFGVLLYAVIGEVFGTNSLSHPRLAAILVVESLVAGALSRVGLRVAVWSDGPDVRAVAE